MKIISNILDILVFIVAIFSIIYLFDATFIHKNKVDRANLGVAGLACIIYWQEQEIQKLKKRIK